MESIGEKLRSTREAKKLSIKDVVKDTNISPTYLEALEDEDFEKFPSETYLIGFLRSYSEYLKLNAEEIIQSYKGYKIGESVTPLEELTKPTRPSFAMIVSNLMNQYRNVVYIAGVVIAVILIFWGFRAIMVDDVDVAGGDSLETIKDEYTAKDKDKKIENIHTLQLSNDKGYVLVYKNEAVQFMVDNKEVVFLLRDITDNAVTLELFPDNRKEVIEIEQPRDISVKGSPRQILFTLKGLTENRAKIMVMLGETLIDKGAGAVTAAVDEERPASTSVIAKNKNNLKIVFEAVFIQKSFIEIYLDGNLKARGFMPAGSRERWEAVEYIQIKIGNAGGIKATINGKNYVFGTSGQVANKVITWKKDVNNPNLYHIHVKDW